MVIELVRFSGSHASTACRRSRLVGRWRLKQWYSLLQTLNDDWLCHTNPPDNFIRVELEADLQTFTKELLEHEAQSFDPRLVLVTSDGERFKAVGFSQSAELDEQSAARLGQLLVLSQSTDWQWRQEAMCRAFWKWSDAFNERNAGCYVAGYE